MQKFLTCTGVWGCALLYDKFQVRFVPHRLLIIAIVPILPPLALWFGILSLSLLPSESGDFVRLLTESQSRLYGYIMTLLPDFVAANEVLSETNVTLWKKSKEFRAGTNFPAWAMRVAYFEVLAYQKRRRADRHIFSGELLEVVAETASVASEDMVERRLALRDCLNKLLACDRKLIGLRYHTGKSVHEIAETSHKTPGAVSQALYRIRIALTNCIERTITGGSLS